MDAWIVLQIQISLIVLLVLLLRACMSRLPKRWSYGLWIIVFLRLLIPVSVESPLGILPGEESFGWIRRQAAVEEARRLPDGALEETGQQLSADGNERDISAKEQYPLAGTDDGERRETEPAAGAYDGAAPAGTQEYSWPAIAFLTVWLAGLTAMLGYNLHTLVQMRRRLRTAEWLERELYICPEIESPFVMGLLRPRIYLPTGLEPEKQAYIICHERVHIRRGDHLVKGMAFLLTAFYWYNPFVWAAFCMLEQDMEMSCDEAVVKSMGSEVRKAYSQSLLDYAAGREGAVAAPPAFGEHGVKQRVKNILSEKSYKWWGTLAGVCLLALAAFLTFTARRGAQQDTRREEVRKKLAEGAVFQSLQPEGNEMGDMPEYKPGDRVEELPGECYEQIYGGNGIFYLNTRYGIYRKEEGAEGTVYTCLYPRYIGWPQPHSLYPRLTLHPNLEKLFFVTDSEYTEESLDWWDDCIVSLDLRTLETEIVARDEGEDPPQVWFDRIDAFYGIRPAEKVKGSEWEDMVADWGDDLLEQYELVRSLKMDVADCPGDETIEVYALREDSELTGTYGGVTRVLDGQGKLLLTEVANLPMLGHNALYVGNRDGQDFLMNFYLEDRGTYGVYRYEVYRLTKEGGIEQIAGSMFDWDYDEMLGENARLYNDRVFREWAQQLQDYMEAGQLLMSTLEWELETDPTVRPYRYNYDSLSRGHEGEGLKGREFLYFQF